MFRRHRTDPNRDSSTVVMAFHGRLAGMLATPHEVRPIVDRPNLRLRLAGPPTGGLRERIDSRATT